MKPASPAVDSVAAIRYHAGVADLVDAKPLSGFQDLLPPDALAFERAVECATAVFRRHGYVPIDTPCIYRYETLTGGRAGIDKQLFDWHKQEGAADRRGPGEHVALRFDLTVPLARYLAANASRLTFPFRRYDVGKVWRGERPQKGRYREFTQCDFDLVGSTAPTADLEIALVIADLMDALAVGPFIVHLNDRTILNGLLEGLGLGGRASDVLRVIDKLDKAGPDGVRAELLRPADEVPPGLGLDPGAVDAILEFVGLSSAGDVGLLDELAKRFRHNPIAAAGVDRLRFVLNGARRLRGAERFVVDLAIARGLGYYTGTVYETILTGAPGFGSVCSGGRYDDLAEAYMRQRLPGVGASLGLSRLLAALGEGARLRDVDPCPVVVLVAPGVDPLEGLALADRLRAAGIGAEAYPQASAENDAVKIARQFKYADARGKAVAVLLAPAEQARGVCVIKDMRSGVQSEVALAEVAATLSTRLGAGG